MGRVKMLTCIVLALPCLAAPAAKRPPLSPAHAAAKKMSRLTIQQQPLADVIRLYEKLIGLRIEVDWGALGKLGVTRATEVTLSSGPMPFAKVLDLTLARAAGAKAPLAWDVRGDALVVSTQKRVLQRRHFRRTLSVRPPRPRRSSGRRAATARPTRKTFPVVEFDNEPLADVFDFFRDAANINLVVNWRSLELVGVGKDSPVTLKVRNVNLSRAIELTLGSFNSGQGPLNGVYCVFDDGVYTVATGAILDQQRMVQIYDVADLLVPVPDFRGQPLDTGTESGSSGGSRDRSFQRGGHGGGQGGGFGDRDRQRRDGDDDGDDTSMTEQRQQRSETLIDIVKSTIGEEFWQPVGRGSVHILRGTMIINQSRLGFLLMDRSLRGTTLRR